MKKRNILLTAAFLIILGISAFGLRGKSFLADLFQGGNEEPPKTEQIYIPSDFLAAPGDSGEIFLKSAANWKSVAAFSFRLHWDQSKATFLKTTKEGTVFDQSGFTVQENYNSQSPGELQVTVLGSSVVDVSPNDLLLKVGFKIADNVAAAEKIALEFVSGVNSSGAEIVFENPNSDPAFLSENPSTRNGRITVAKDAKTISGTPPPLNSAPGNTISFRAPESLTGVVGLEFMMEWNAEQATFIEAKKGSAFSGDQFLLDSFEQNPGMMKVAVVGVPGGNISAGEPLISFTMEPDVALPVGTTINFLLRDITFTEEDLSTHPADDQTVSLTVSQAGTLELTNVVPTSLTSVDLTFSDFITNARISDFTITPNLIQNSSAIRVEGETKKVILENLAPQQPETRYRIDVHPGVMGNVQGAISPEFATGFFHGFPSSKSVSPFRVLSSEARSDTEILLTFSRPVNGASIETTDFTIPGLTIVSVQKTSVPTQVLVKTSSQGVLGNDVLLTIANTSAQHDLKSQENDLLSQNVISIVPFGKSGPNAPKLLSAKFETAEKLSLTFDIPITASSLTSGDITVRKIGTNTNVVGNNAPISLSPDFKTASVSPVPNGAGRLYQVELSANGITAQNGTANGNFSRTAVSFGYNTLFNPWNFSMESVHVTSSSSLDVVFSEIPDSAAITPLSIEILHDVNGKTESLTVSEVVKNNRKITLKTAAQAPGEEYFLLVKRSNVKNGNGQPLNARNGLSFRGFTADQARILTVEPTDIIQDEDHEITLGGENFTAGSLVTVGGKSVSIVSIEPTEIAVIIPAGFQTGDLEVTLTTPDGNIISAPEHLTVREVPEVLTVLSEENYASPARVMNDGQMKTTLWVRVLDPRGVSDLEKVSANLSPLNGPAVAVFRPKEITELKQWFSLEITVPPTVQISEETPYEIAVTAENKSGESASGAVPVFVVREAEASNPPVIVSAKSNIPSVPPGSDISFKFFVQVSDPDGEDDIRNVVVDATALGLGPTLLTPIEGSSDEIFPPDSCTPDDYILEEFGPCQDGIQTRTVSKKQGVDCRDEPSVREELSRRSCTDESDLRACEESDYSIGTWGECMNGTQERIIELFSDDCLEDPDTRPEEERSCTTARNLLEDFFFPKVFAQSSEGSVKWYESVEFTLPNYVATGAYKLPVTVTDRHGKSATGTVEFSVQRNRTGDPPRIDRHDIEISPDNSMVRDDKTTYSITVKVTDKNGGDNVTTVVADLSELRLGVREMTRDVVVGESVYFSLEDLIIPKQAIPGFRVLEFTATDEEGNTSDETANVEIVTESESPEGEAPKVLSDRGFTTPASVPNDGVTQFSIYAFVEDPNGHDDIEYVTIELGNVARFVGEISQNYNPRENVNSDGNDNTNNEEDDTAFQQFFPVAHAATALPPDVNCLTTDAITCMFPKATQGANVRLFYLPEVVIPRTTPVPPNGEPYLLKVTATDSSGRIGEGLASIFVSDGNLPQKNDPKPQLNGVVATALNTVEVLFSSPLPQTERITSAAFRIVKSLNVMAPLPIRGIDIGANGTLVTLTTNAMISDEKYTLIIDAEKLGVNHPTFTSDRAEFSGYSEDMAKRSRAPIALKAEAVGTKSVEILFSEPLKFSTLKADSFRIFEKENNRNLLEITNVRFGDDATKVLISTGLQKINQQYTLKVQNVENVYGLVRKEVKELPFKGYSGDSEMRTRLWNQADLNTDGTVDFLDFTLFSSVYGSTESNAPGDLTGDGVVDFNDFTAFAALYGTLPPPPPENEDDGLPTDNDQDLDVFDQGGGEE